MSGKANLARQILTGFGASGTSCSHHANETCRSSRPLVVNYSTKDTGSTLPEYAFQMSSSTIRFGPGVTSEVGYDIQTFGGKNTLLVTDPNVVKLPSFQAAADSLKKAGVKFTVFDEVQTEPTDKTFQKAIDFARNGGFDSFVAIGGGSTIDTTKTAAIFSANKDAVLTDYLNKPFGKQLTPEKPMLPLVAIPTTAGTGSETTTVAVLDIEELNIKTAIRQPALKPHLALVDPNNVMSMPRHVAIYSGFDVLCHALESYTARPFFERYPRPNRPSERPVFQGSNPISDVWCKKALEIIRDNFQRAVADPDDFEARSNMILASTFAGIGFGNAGVTLPHSLSYPIAGMNKAYTSPDYDSGHPLIPHGLAVTLTACADFEFTGEASPQRHLEAANFLGHKGASEKSAGHILSDVIRGFMSDFKVANGLRAVGFDSSDVPKLAKATFESKNQALAIAPREQTEEQLAELFEESLVVY